MPAETVRSYLAAFASADPETIASHVAEDFVNEHTSALGDNCEGRDCYRERLVDFLDEFAGLAYEVEDMVADADRVYVSYRMTARFKRKPVDIRGVMRLEVRDGGIARRTEYFDSLTFLRQTGQQSLANP